MIPLATPEGLEPPTLGSEDQCSIQLSYGATLITCQFTTPYKIPPERVWFDVALSGPAISGRLLRVLRGADARARRLARS